MTREKFAVSLRKEKKQRILDVKRKKTYELLGLDTNTMKQERVENVMMCIPEELRTAKGVHESIAKVPTLIKDGTKQS